MTTKNTLTGLLVILLAGAIYLVVRTPDSADQDGRSGLNSQNEEGEEGHGHQELRLSEDQMKEFGIEVEAARPGILERNASLPGEVRLNADSVVHITPRAGGVVREVHAKLGDMVQSGQLLAVLESREIAGAKATYLSRLEKLALADAAYRREETLWKVKKITSEQEYLDAKQARAEARIELRSAENQLHALGFTAQYLSELPEKQNESYARFEVLAPRNGIIIEKHVTLGEVLRNDSNMLTLADLSTVWIDLRMYPRDLAHLHEGQKVTIVADAVTHSSEGTIAYLSPVLDEHTRTALARVVLPNAEGRWRPGLFVTGRLTLDKVSVEILVPKTALVEVEGKTSVFVEEDKNVFVPVPVSLGRANETHVEVQIGLWVDQRYVTKGSFTLKSEMGKAGFGHAGHAH